MIFTKKNKINLLAYKFCYCAYIMFSDIFHYNFYYILFCIFFIETIEGESIDDLFNDIFISTNIGIMIAIYVANAMRVILFKGKAQPINHNILYLYQLVTPQIVRGFDPNRLSLYSTFAFHFSTNNYRV